MLVFLQTENRHSRSNSSSRSSCCCFSCSSSRFGTTSGTCSLIRMTFKCSRLQPARVISNMLLLLCHCFVCWRHYRWLHFVPVCFFPSVSFANNHGNAEIETANRERQSTTDTERHSFHWAPLTTHPSSLCHSHPLSITFDLFFSFLLPENEVYINGPHVLSEKRELRIQCNISEHTSSDRSGVRW